MSYPRTTILGDKVLVDDTQIVGYREHLTEVHRIVPLTGIISGSIDIHDQLMSMDEAPYNPVKLVITSGGGELDSVFLFYDTIKMMKSPVITIGRYCASAAVLLLASGSKRYLYPHARVMLHLVAGQMAGDYKDFEIQRKQMQDYQNKVIDILLDCGVRKSREEVLRDIDRDFWLSPTEAIAYGLADEIISPQIWAEMIKED